MIKEFLMRIYQSSTTASYDLIISVKDNGKVQDKDAFINIVTCCSDFRRFYCRNHSEKFAHRNEHSSFWIGSFRKLIEETMFHD